MYVSLVLSYTARVCFVNLSVGHEEEESYDPRSQA